jgi:hypothetical protein
LNKNRSKTNFEENKEGRVLRLENRKNKNEEKMFLALAKENSRLKN